MKLAAVVLLLAALAAWATWPESTRELWAPFDASAVAQVVFLGEGGAARELQFREGRVRAVRPLELVFRRSDEPRELSIVEARGRLLLFLGDDGPTLSLERDHLVLDAGAGPETLDTGDVPLALTLRCTDGRCVVLAGGFVLADRPWTRPAPHGRVGVRMEGQTSFHEVTLVAEGEPQVLRPESRGDDYGPPVWAALATLLALPALTGWWRSWRRRAPPRAADVVLAGCVALAVAAGPATLLHARNRERMLPPAVVCATEPLERPEAVTVRTFEPLEIAGRRDGDYELTADVTLQPQTVLDILVRGSPSGRDCGLVVTLSSDARLSSGLARNHSVEWLAQPAPEALAQLAPGRPLKLRIRAQDTLVQADVDGQPLGEVTDIDLRAGRTAFHALAGEATVAALSLQPLQAPRDILGKLLGWMALAGGVALLALALAALAGGAWVPMVLAAAPLAVACWPWAPAAALPAGATLAAALMLLTAGRRWLLVLVPLAALIVACGLASHEAPLEITPVSLDQLDLADVRGPPMPAAFAWARHPLLRRFNSFCRNQELRAGPVAPEPAAGVRRVLTLGSSSTFGYGVGTDQTWSALLGERLGPGWDVVNGGVSGATAERLRFLLDGVLLRLHPTIVVVDLGFNDHVMGPVGNERAHFAAMTSTGLSWLDQLREWWRGEGAREDWITVYHALQLGETLEPAQYEAYVKAPASRFADSLRDIVTSCRGAGAQVLLVCEPVRPGHVDPVLDAFREAMRGVGSAESVPVLEPQAAAAALGDDGFVDVVHPTEAGHRVIAEQVALGLAGAGWVGSGR